MQGTPNHQAGSPFNALGKQATTVSVVICTRFRPAALRKCLLAVSRLKRAPEELIVVDNSAGDKATEELAREFSARYLIEPIAGLSRARNSGLSASRSEIVAYLDDDALPDERWLEHLIEPFSDSRVAVVTGAAIVPDGESSCVQPTQPTHLDKSDNRWFEIAAFGGLGIGTNMALRKSACKRDNFFDERLGRGAPFDALEERHAFVQLLAQDYCAVHVPAAIVFHSSQNPLNVKREARNQFAYSMLLFSEFPDHRAQLLQFLFRRMRQRPLTWPRDSPDPGMIASSSWWLLLKASLSGALLYFKTRR